MNTKYSNFDATMALAKASFRSILRSPSAVVFTLAFPLIFILVFGFLGNSGIKTTLVVMPNSDVNNPMLNILRQVDMIKLIANKDEKQITAGLEKGDFDASIDVQKNPSGVPLYTAKITYTSASVSKGNILKSIFDNIKYNLNTQHIKPSVVEISSTTLQARPYKSIDFILPGQLGFSLLSTGVFGTAFVFFSLRQNLVIKRFFATPVKKYSIVIGEGIARIGFALIGALIIVLIGHFAFDFTLIHGTMTVINMLILATIGVIVFMGFGFVVSGLAKSESTIPPISNIITLPQFLLSGTFFSVEAFPGWLQPISKALPLTYLNDAMRKVAFEGANLWDVKHQIIILIIWGLGIYTLAVKFFKWE